MKCYVVCEGATNALLLREVLGGEFQVDGTEVAVASGSGWSSAESLARTILAVRRAPVALIVDADSSDPETIRERQGFLDASLGQFRSPYAAFAVAPEFEVILFKSPELLERAGFILSERDLLRAQFEPKRLIQELSGGKPDEFVQRLIDTGAADLLANIEPIPALRAFLGANLRTAAAA